MIVAGPTSAAVILNNSLSAEISCRAIGLLSISFPRFFYPHLVCVCRNNVLLACMCVHFCVHVSADVCVACMCIPVSVRFFGVSFVCTCVLVNTVCTLGNAFVCVCVCVCMLRVMGFFQIHTVTPMCPAIDLEMTGLLTHTICSANEERQREGEKQWMRYSPSLFLSSLEHFKMKRTTTRKRNKWRTDW